MPDYLGDTFITIDPVTGVVSVVFSGTVQADGIIFTEHSINKTAPLPSHTDQIIWEDSNGQIYQYITGYLRGSGTIPPHPTSVLEIGSVLANATFSQIVASIYASDLTTLLQQLLILNDKGQSAFSLPLVKDVTPVSINASTGNTSIKTVTIPGSIMGVNGTLRITFLINVANSSGAPFNLNVRARYAGGTGINQPVIPINNGANSYLVYGTFELTNQSVTSQIGMTRYEWAETDNGTVIAPSTLLGGFTQTIDTTTDFTVELRVSSSVNSGLITITCQRFEIELI